MEGATTMSVFALARSATSACELGVWPVELEFVLANGRRVRVPVEVVDRIVTTRLSSCFTSRCYMSPKEALGCVGWIAGKAEAVDPWACIWHMLFYAENLTFSVYLYKLALNDDPCGYLEFMMPALEKARELARGAWEQLDRGRFEEARKLAQQLLDHLLAYGIDPW